MGNGPPKAALDVCDPAVFQSSMRTRGMTRTTETPSLGALPWLFATPAFVRPSRRPGPPVFRPTDRSLCAMRWWASSPASSHTEESTSERPGHGHVRGRPRSPQGGSFQCIPHWRLRPRCQGIWGGGTGAPQHTAFVGSQGRCQATLNHVATSSVPRPRLDGGSV